MNALHHLCCALVATAVGMWGTAAHAQAPAARPAPGPERAIQKSVLIAASLDEAWAAWTTREGIVGFFAPDAKVEPRVGGAFQIYMDPGAPAGSKGADDMRFMAVQPKKMLSFDWNAPPSLPEVRAQRSFVIVRFVPQGERATEVHLHHVGWGEGGEWDKAHAYFDRAWAQVLANLKRRFEQGPQDWGPWLKQLEQWRAQAAARAASASAITSPAAVTPAGAASAPTR
jgi:uncharacterized protein YndB with AHSA1/START domain